VIDLLIEGDRLVLHVGALAALLHEGSPFDAKPEHQSRRHAGCACSDRPGEARNPFDPYVNVDAERHREQQPGAGHREANDLVDAAAGAALIVIRWCAAGAIRKPTTATIISSATASHCFEDVGICSNAS
jgi:hypothetical protein